MTLHDELDEAAFEDLVTFVGVSDESLLGGREVVVSPKLLHELEDVKLELVGVDSCESGQGEGPTEKRGTEGD